MFYISKQLASILHLNTITATLRDHYVEIWQSHAQITNTMLGYFHVWTWQYLRQHIQDLFIASNDYEMTDIPLAGRFGEIKFSSHLAMQTHTPFINYVHVHKLSSIHVHMSSIITCAHVLYTCAHVLYNYMCTCPLYMCTCPL